MLKIRSEQYQLLQKDAVRSFYQSLFTYLHQSFPEYGISEQRILFTRCIEYANKEGIVTEYGLTSLTTVSFMLGDCIANDPDYREFHAECVAVTSDPEAAINAIYEGLY